MEGEVTGHIHPHVISRDCHCVKCRPLERPCGCRGCEDLKMKHETEETETTTK